MTIVYANIVMFEYSGGGKMTLVKVFTAIFFILCLAITIVILLQEGKQAGLGGAISGAADSYWGKNKGRSIEGALEKATKIMVVLFFIISILLNTGLMEY